MALRGQMAVHRAVSIEQELRPPKGSSAKQNGKRSTKKSVKRKASLPKPETKKREANRAAAQRCRMRRVNLKAHLETQLTQCLEEQRLLQQQAELLQRMHAREGAAVAAIKQFVVAHRHFRLGVPLPESSRQQLALLLQDPEHPEAGLLPPDLHYNTWSQNLSSSGEDEADSGDCPRLRSLPSSQGY